MRYLNSQPLKDYIYMQIIKAMITYKMISYSAKFTNSSLLGVFYIDVKGIKHQSQKSSTTKLKII